MPLYYPYCILRISKEGGGHMSEYPLVNRKQFTSTMRNDLMEAFNQLHEETRIPKSKLQDEAIEDLLRKYHHESPEK